MKVHVAPDLCCGAQRCWDAAPEFYKLKDGFSIFVSEHENFPVPPEMEEAAVRGAEACPESAISIIRDDN